MLSKHFAKKNRNYTKKAFFPFSVKLFPLFGTKVYKSKKQNSLRKKLVKKKQKKDEFMDAGFIESRLAFLGAAVVLVSLLILVFG